jgi:hypothetical protein
MLSTSSSFLFFKNREDDSNWPTKNVVGSQEIEIRLGNEHVSFEVKRERERERYQ